MHLHNIVDEGKTSIIFHAFKDPEDADIDMQDCCWPALHPQHPVSLQLLL